MNSFSREGLVKLNLFIVIAVIATSLNLSNFQWCLQLDSSTPVRLDLFSLEYFPHSWMFKLNLTLNAKNIMHRNT